LELAQNHNEEPANQKLMLSPKDVSTVLGISMPTVYELWRKDGFPGIKIGPRKWLVNREKLFTWLENKK
jgi:excisionase family DNA binding protein